MLLGTQPGAGDAQCSSRRGREMTQALDSPLTCWAGLGKVPNFQDIYVENRDPGIWCGRTQVGLGGSRSPKGKPPGEEGNLHVANHRQVPGLCTTPWHCIRLAAGSWQCKKETWVEMRTSVCRREAMRMQASQVLFNCLQNQYRPMLSGKGRRSCPRR